MDGPLAFFITFTTYGTRLHGDERGSVDRRNNGYGSDGLGLNPRREQHALGTLRARPQYLDEARRERALRAVEALFERRKWGLLAVNVRTNHVHVVGAIDGKPDQAMASMKAWITAALRNERLLGANEPLWTRHGSTRYLWDEESVELACRYVRDGQGFELPGSVLPRE